MPPGKAPLCLLMIVCVPNPLGHRIVRPHKPTPHIQIALCCTRARPPQQHCMAALPCACFRPVRNMAIPSPCKQNPCTRSTHHAPTPTHPCAQTPGAWCTQHGHLGALPEYARGAASPALPQSHMHAWPSAPTHPMHGAFIVVLLEHARGCCLPARMQRGTGGAERAALPRELE